MNDTESTSTALKARSELADSFFQFVVNKPETFYVLVGSDYRIALRSLATQKIPDGTRFLIVERDDLAADDDLIPGDRGRKFSLASVETFVAQALQLGIDKYIFTNGVQLLKFPASGIVDSDVYQQIYDQVSYKLASLFKQRLSGTHTLHYLPATLANAAHNCRPAIQLKDSLSGAALVVGAGPSVERHLDWIKQNQGDLSVYAVSRMVQFLEKNGIHVDFILSIDPLDINYRQSLQMFNYRKTATLIYGVHVNHRLLSQWHGDAYYLGDLLPWKPEFPVPNYKIAQPTVTQNAISVAMTFGHDEIFLSGVDLCYDSAGTKHAGSKRTDIDKDNIHLVETYAGNKAETTFFMEQAIDKTAELVAGFEGKIYNLNEDAAQIPGIEYLPEPKPQQPSQQVIRRNEPAVANHKKHLMAVKTELQNSLSDFSNISNQCKDSLKLIRQISSNSTVERTHKLQIKIDKIENKIKAKYPVEIYYLQHAASGQLLSNLSISDRADFSATEKARWLTDYYRSLLESSENIIAEIQKSIELTNAYELEFADNPDQEKLRDFWADSGVFGRACIFVADRDPVLAVSEDLQCQCELFRQETSFDTNLAEFLRCAGLDYRTPTSEEVATNLLLRVNETLDSSQSNEQSLLVAIAEFLQATVYQWQDDNDKATECYRNIADLVTTDARYFYPAFTSGFLQSITFRMMDIDTVDALHTSVELLSKIRQSDFNAYFLEKLISGIYEGYDAASERFTVRLLHWLKDPDISAGTKQVVADQIKILFPVNGRIESLATLLTASALKNEGRQEDAREVFDQLLNTLLPADAVELNFNDPLLASTLSQMLDISSLQEKIQIYELLVQVSKKYLKDLGLLLLDHDETESARYVLEQYIDYKPLDEEALALLFDIYKQAGNQELMALTRELLDKIRDAEEQD